MEDQTSVKTRAGRKTKYSPALINKLIRYIEDGLNLKQSCLAAGIGETTLREWRNEHEGLEERIEQAREVMRAKVLAEIKAAGAKEWRAHAEFLRLAFAEYRFGQSPQINVAVQNTMHLTDPERADLIARREKALALAASNAASAPLQLEDARDAREIAEAAERELTQPQEPPKQLMPPKPEPMSGASTLATSCGSSVKRTV